jgi:hypothetical protein
LPLIVLQFPSAASEWHCQTLLPTTLDAKPSVTGSLKRQTGALAEEQRFIPGNIVYETLVNAL